MVNIKYMPLAFPSWFASLLEYPSFNSISRFLKQKSLLIFQAKPQPGNRIRFPYKEHEFGNTMLSTSIFSTSLLLALECAATFPLPRSEVSLDNLFLHSLQGRGTYIGSDCGNGVCVPTGYHWCSDVGTGCPAGFNCVPDERCPTGGILTLGAGLASITGGCLGAASSLLDTSTISSLNGYGSFIATAHPSSGSAGAVGGGTTSTFPAVVATSIKQLDQRFACFTLNHEPPSFNICVRFAQSVSPF